MVFPSLLLLLLIVSMPEIGEKTSLGLISLSSGSWAAYGELDGFEISPYEGEIEKYVFNKLLAVSLYGGLGRYGYHIGLPWQWTVKSLPEGSVNRIDPGDLTAYLSKRWGLYNARLGFSLPAGYDSRNGDPWIGQGNRQLVLGTAARLPLTLLGSGAGGALEADGSYSLDDGLAKRGSFSLSPSVKIWKRFHPGLKGEFYLYSYYKSYYWSRGVSVSQSLWGAQGPAADRSAGIVPGLSVETRLTPKTHLGLKGGHSLWGYRDKASYHFAVFLNVFP